MIKDNLEQDVQNIFSCGRWILLIGIAIWFLFNSWSLAFFGLGFITFFLLLTYPAIFPRYYIGLLLHIALIPLLVYIQAPFRFVAAAIVGLIILIAVIIFAYSHWQGYKFETTGIVFLYPNHYRYKTFNEFYRYEFYPDIFEDAKEVWKVFIGGTNACK